MNFFMLSKCGEGAGLLNRIQEEGNSCCIKITDKEYTSVYDGILEKSESPKEDDTIIIVDSSGMGKEIEEYKKKGFKVFGGSSFADKLENDRNFGLDFMKYNDIKIPETEEFHNFSSGISFIKKNKDKKFVFKPSGKNIPCKLTYCSEDFKDLLSYLSFVEENYGKYIEDFILQEFIEGPIISTEFWVGKNGFITPANHTVEVKKFLNDNLGPSTGCQGNLVWLAEDDIIVDHLLKLEECLKSENFIGCLDLNAIIHENEVFGLEWTPRFGLDAMPTFLRLCDKIEVGKLISDIVDGTVHEMNGLIDEFAGGVRLTIPPYPAEPKKVKSLNKEIPNIGVPIRGLDSPGTYYYEVMKKENELIHSIGTGVIAVISDRIEDPESCFDGPYEIFDGAKIPDKQYRTDLDEILPRMYSEAMEALNA